MHALQTLFLVGLLHNISAIDIESGLKTDSIKLIAILIQWILILAIDVCYKLFNKSLDCFFLVLFVHLIKWDILEFNYQLHTPCVLVFIFRSLRYSETPDELKHNMKETLFFIGLIVLLHL